MDSQIRYQFAELERLAMSESQTTAKLDQEIAAVRQKFPIPTFEMADELQVRQYVRLHQYSLVRLMDRLNARSTRPRMNEAYQRLNDVLEFLATDFKEYFDLDSKAPDQEIKIAKRDAKKHVAKLTNSLTQRNIDRHLIEICIHSISRLEKDYRNSLTSFRRIAFTNEVQAMIYELADKNQTNLEEQLESMLFYLNCNSIKVFLYQTQHLQGQLGVMDSNSDRLEKLAFALKKVNQVQVKQGVGYNIHGTSLKELVSSYLSEEMSYLERMISPPPTSSSDKVFQDFRLKVNLSVSQVAYVFRIFIENQFIQTKNQTELLKLLSRILVTKKAESVSFDSLRAKYYNIETGTKESVRDALSSLVRYVDKN